MASTPTAIECLVEPLQLLHERMPPMDGDPGWDISDEIELLPRGECRYVIELVRGQGVLVEIVSAFPIETSIWDDDTYDRAERACQPHGGRDFFRALSVSSSISLAFSVPETGVYDVVVRNPEDWLISAAVRIIAPPIP